MSQGSLNVPITGPVSPTAFAGDINSAFDALVSKNSGGSAPANFPTSPGAATTFEDWADTSPGAGIIDEREFDGTNWLIKGSMDQTAHVWMPKVGGGSGTIAAAGSTDIGSVRQSYMTVTGSVPGTPITSFGSNALLTVGETKFLRFTAAGIITYNATTMILPGAADLPFNAGDTLQATYLGGGNWLAYDFRSNVSAEGRETGDVFEKWATAAFGGSVRANGLTIGNAASGGTERANADTVNLFIFLYINDTTLAVSGGRTAPGTTRANAITDYNLNKTITLPNIQGVKALQAVQRFTSGAANYTPTANTRAIKVRMCAAGGGGGGGTANNGNNGADTSFGAWTAIHGNGGLANLGSTDGNTGGLGGTGGVNGTGTLVVRIDGGNGSAITQSGSSATNSGGIGGSNPFGGFGSATHGNGTGGAAKANTGGGGAGGGSTNSNNGAGGGAGEYVEFWVTAPGVIAYSVGTKGTGGAAGTAAGGDGANGIIIVEEYTGPTSYLAL
jgi:hypothetical protein